MRWAGFVDDVPCGAGFDVGRGGPGRAAEGRLLYRTRYGKAEAGARGLSRRSTVGSSSKASKLFSMDASILVVSRREAAG